MDVLTILGYIGALATGLILGLLGGGGALMSVPVLVYFFHVDAATATGYSMFLVAVSGWVGSVQNFRKQLIDFKALAYYTIPSIATVYSVRRFVMPNLPDVFFSIGSYEVDKDHFILYLLAIVMVAIGYRMVNAGKQEQPEGDTKLIHLPKLIISAVLIGFFIGIVGAGGGFLMTPVLIYFAGLNIRKAIATSLVLVALNSTMGFIGDIHGNENLDWKFLVVFAALSVTGVISGIYFSDRIDSLKLKKYFGWFILFVAALIVAKETFFK